MVEAVKSFNVSLSDALASITLSPANILQLHNKGRIAQDVDADINLLNQESLPLKWYLLRESYLRCKKQQLIE